VDIHIGGDNKNIGHILSPNAFLLSKIALLFFDKDGDKIASSFNIMAHRTLNTRNIFTIMSDRDNELSKTIIDFMNENEEKSNVKLNSICG